MSLQERIEQDFVAARKAGDAAAVQTLRLLKSAFLVKEKEPSQAGKPLGEADELAILRGQIKQRRDSIVAYRDGGRADLADAETAELAILERYLPPQLSADQIRTIVEQVVAAAGDNREFGPIMGQVKKQIGDGADGGTVSTIVREVLAEKNGG